jgi:hypothetical protein
MMLRARYARMLRAPARMATVGRRKVIDMLANSYPFLDIMWTMLVFFAWVIWIYLLVMVLGDNFRRRDHNGWAKAGWTLFVIFLPLLGALVYMIARPPEDSTLYAPGQSSMSPRTTR